MNYSVIQSAVEKFDRYEKKYMGIAKSIDVSAHTLSLTDLSSVEKSKV
jgi:hypothetical protein